MLGILTCPSHEIPLGLKCGCDTGLLIPDAEYFTLNEGELRTRDLLFYGLVIPSKNQLNQKV